MQRKGAAVFGVFLILAFAALLVQTVKIDKMTERAKSEKSRAFYELSENIEKTESALIKAALACDEHALKNAAAEIRECTAFAVSDLGRMHTGDEGAAKITEFLNQAADYAKSAVLSGAEAKDNKEAFIKLSQYASRLKREMERLGEKATSGEITLLYAVKNLPDIGDEVSKIENGSFTDYEPLSYDGAFSGHMASLEAAYLKDKETVSAETALKKAMEFLDGKVVLTLSGESLGTVEFYDFTGVKNGATCNVGVTKKGGEILFFNSDYMPGNGKITEDEALNIALDFAAMKGFSNLKKTDAVMSGNFFGFSFAPVENGIIMYPDGIKIQVAADSGAISFFSAYDYIMNSHQRNLDKPSYELRAEEFDEKFKTESINMAVIPTSYAKELYCYEIVGKFNSKIVRAYINAETGRHEQTIVGN